MKYILFVSSIAFLTLVTSLSAVHLVKKYEEKKPVPSDVRKFTSKGGSVFYLRGGKDATITKDKDGNVIGIKAGHDDITITGVP